MLHAYETPKEERPRLAGKQGSCWAATAPRTNYPPLRGAATCDVVIVGAGIVGLTAALALREKGKSVVLVEARKIGGQVTGRSAAKITCQHGLIYRYLIDRFGLELARFYADANRAGMQAIRNWIKEFGITCSYERKAAFAYTGEHGRLPELRDEAAAAREVGFDARVVERAPLPFDTAGALLLPDQAQFNPASYLVWLALALETAGGRIFENSLVHTLEEGNRWRVETGAGSVEAEHLVVATNMPVKSPVGYSQRTQPRSHVAMAFRLARGVALDGMFLGIDAETHSIRTGHDDKGELLVTLGPKFNTGQDGDVARRLVELERWTRANLPAGEALWHWCNEDYDTADRMPYVGEPSPDDAPGFFVATGFNAWGISNGTAAGLMMASQIATGSHPWGALYDPSRPYPQDFHQSGESQSRVSSIDDIPRGAGGVIEKGEEKIAVWRAPDGTARAVSASCTHKGCTVTWNNAGGTWDCPCHGSIFEADGTVVHGPARAALARREI